MKKFLAVMIAVLVAVSVMATFVPSFAYEGTDLLELEVDTMALAGDTWTVYPGMFCGPLQCPDRGQFEWEAKDADGVRVYPTKEVTVDGGVPVFRFAVEAETGMISYGNFFGIMDKVQANTTYTAVATYKLTLGSNPGYESAIAEPVLGYVNKSGNAGATDKVALTPDSEDYITTEFVFTTGDDVTNACLVVGPNSFTGNTPAGYELLLAGLELYEGDVAENTNTGDTGLMIAAVISVALLATVVFTKKKVYGI